ncbi:MAG TPA: hypothetical protein VIP78_03830 [Candidatus Dormibacteraeota bacterium]
MSVDANAALAQVIDCLQVGLPAEVVAALLRIRFGTQLAWDEGRVATERAYCESVKRDVAGLLARRVLSTAAAAALDHEFGARLATLGAPVERASRPVAAAPVAVEAAEATSAARPVVEPAAPMPVAVAPSPPPISLRELFAEHSVVILASFGAFLLVVATVLFELYGTVGLGGEVRLGAVVALNLIFAAAGYLANRRERLRSVGSIYIGLAAVLLPLVALAAWTFLELGARGITVNQALAVSGAACAVVYGFLALRLGLRAYGEMAGIAVLVASWGVSNALLGHDWRSIGLALTPLVFAVVERLLPDRVFSHFQWFAHAAVLAALAAALRVDPELWVWTATLGTIAVVYLIWQAVARSPLEGRGLGSGALAWIGEASLVLAATAAIGPLGLKSNNFVWPMLVAVPLVVLARVPGSLGMVGRLYRAHPALIHLAVISGIALAVAENVIGETWPLATAVWIAVGLYAADFWLGRTENSGYALRAALPAAVAATGEAWALGSWGATLTATSLIAYSIAFVSGPALKALTRQASIFFYAVLVLVAVQLAGASIGAGRWEIPATLLVSAAAFVVASEMGAVRFSPYAARALFSLAWFAGVDALNAQGWRGPFDALLALVYVAAGRLRALATHSVATAGRRWFVHLAALGALVLCFTGPDDLLWWRLAAASGALAFAYWWLALVRDEQEMPWLAWAALSAAADSLVLAWIPQTWQGTAIAGSAVVLTGAWAVGRRRLTRPELESSALPVLGALAAVGAVLTLRQEIPHWSQAIALLLGGGFLLPWSRLRSAPVVLIQSLRAGAAALAAIGLLIGAGVLHLNAGYAGLLALAIAGFHAEWTVQAKGPIERWYAVAALLVMAPVIYFWPYEKTPVALVAVEFVALAVLCVQAGARRDQWFLAYPAALLLAVALHVSFIALGPAADGARERIAFAVLAWIIGFMGLALRATYGQRWALSTEFGAATIASGALAAMAVSAEADPAGIALLAYAPVIYSAGIQEREQWVLPVAVIAALVGIFTLLNARGADTILYAAGLGLVGLVVWVAGWVATAWLGRHAVVDMHRYLGLGLLVVASLAGFAFPDRTGPTSSGAELGALALLITGGVFWFDSITFGFRPNHYLALVSATAAGYFVARYLNLESWALVPPGLGVIACGITLRKEMAFHLDHAYRQLIVGIGLALVMGWAAVLTVTGDPWWLVALLVEGALTVGAGIVLRSRVLLAGGGIALALVSLRALLTVAQAGYLFAAFGAVALLLLAVATVLALSRDRTLAGARGVREQLALWD